jgi:hypothetical protein
VVATAEKDGLNIRRNSTVRLRQPAIAEQSRLVSTCPSVQFSKGHTGLFSGQVGDPGTPQSIAQTGKMGAWADEQGRFSDHATAHSKHRIATAPFQRGVHRTGPSCVSFEETQARTALRQAALPSFHVSFRSADIESAPH